MTPSAAASTEPSPAATTTTTMATLHFADLPSETQSRIFECCSSPDLVALSLVSKHFRDLAAEQLYRNFHIVFPDDDDVPGEGLIDGLAAGLDTFVTSEYDYARYLREIALYTFEGGDKAERSYRPYLYSTSCGKFMSTLLLMTLRKAKALETFRWDIRVELSRPVFKALHQIACLKHLHLRMQLGPSLYESPPPLPPSKKAADPNDGWVPAHSELAFAHVKTIPGFLDYHESKAVLHSSRQKDSNIRSPPTICGFKNLKSLTILDMDTLEYITEIKTCVRNSSNTLNSLQLSFSESLASQARKPAIESPHDEDSDQDEDDFGNPTLPPSDDATGPAKVYKALEKKKLQEAVLGKIFGVTDSKVKPSQVKTDYRKSSGDSVEDQTKKLLADALRSFRDDLRTATAKVLATVSPTNFEDAKSLAKTMESVAAIGFMNDTKDPLLNKDTASEKSKPTTEVAEGEASSSSAVQAPEIEKQPDAEPAQKPSALLCDEHKNSTSTTGNSNCRGCRTKMEDTQQSLKQIRSDVAKGIAYIDGNGYRITVDDVDQSLADIVEIMEDGRLDNQYLELSKDRYEAHRNREQSDYLRKTRGLSLETLSIHLIPVRASTLSNAIDLHALRNITLLSVGAQAPFWNMLAKENNLKKLQIKKIHTDNVTGVFLTLVSQLEGLQELYLLERCYRSRTESVPPKTTIKIKQIRRLALKTHISTLRCLRIRNEADYSWDADEKTARLLCSRAKNLEELAVSFGIHVMHTLLQNLPGLVNLRALHILQFRTDDTCMWVMREVRKFAIDCLSQMPATKVEYLALDTSVERLVRRRPKAHAKKSKKARGKEKSTSSSSTATSNPSLSDLVLLSGTLAENTATNQPELLDDETSDDDDGGDGVVGPGMMRIEAMEGLYFHDVSEVGIFRNDVLLGRL